MIPHTNLRSITDEENSTISKMDNQCAEDTQGCSRSTSNNNDHSSILQRIQDRDEYIEATKKRRENKQLQQAKQQFEQYIQQYNITEQLQQYQQCLRQRVNSKYQEQTEKSFQESTSKLLSSCTTSEQTTQTVNSDISNLNDKSKDKIIVEKQKQLWSNQDLFYLISFLSGKFLAGIPYWLQASDYIQLSIELNNTRNPQSCKQRFSEIQSALKTQEWKYPALRRVIKYVTDEANSHLITKEIAESLQINKNAEQIVEFLKIMKIKYDAAYSADFQTK
ncbi:Hypothetical_protein [Hexamita inflata]|uniref:Hypothetical_protein n=1 Tax=Hexamita inflata TaxID=28002 RepID=A0AA86V0P5_9EUKA|nr:Hypothetical protein HINF_LOCUS59342 [Hexamita inflata]